MNVFTDSLEPCRVAPLPNFPNFGAAVGRIDREIGIACGAGIGFVELELKSREQTVNADGEVLPTRALGDLAVELSF